MLEQRGTPTLDIWPENVEVWEVWRSMETQWRVGVGMGGVVYLGLDYAALPSVYEGVGVKKRRRREVFNALREMEKAAKPVLNGSDESVSDE